MVSGRRFEGASRSGLLPAGLRRFRERSVFFFGGPAHVLRVGAVVAGSGGVPEPRGQHRSGSSRERFEGAWATERGYRKSFVMASRRMGSASGPTLVAGRLVS